jgi:steroid delta-isomerase-like uncharacterized protein
MTRDDVEALFMRRQAAWDGLDARALAADHADGAIVESPLGGGPVTGRAAIEKLYATYFTAFTDLQLHQEDLLIDGDRVALFAHVVGTDLGGFMGMEPTGRPVSIPIMFLYELRDGAIVRERRIYDFTSLLIQVGAIKAKPS